MNEISFGLVRADGRVKADAGTLRIVARGDGADRTDSVEWDLGDFRGKGPAAGVVVTEAWADNVVALRFDIDGTPVDIDIAEGAPKGRKSARLVGSLPLVVGMGNAHVSILPHIRRKALRGGSTGFYLSGAAEMPGKGVAGVDLGDEDDWS